jgi:hypothetical protein
MLLLTSSFLTDNDCGDDSDEPGNDCGYFI